MAKTKLTKSEIAFKIVNKLDCSSWNLQKYNHKFYEIIKFNTKNENEIMNCINEIQEKYDTRKYNIKIVTIMTKYAPELKSYGVMINRI